MIEPEDILAHYGIKGQKWGVQKVSSKDTRSSDKKLHDSARIKKSSELSDKELRDLVNRISTEQQYSRLTPSKLTQGHNIVKTILAAGITVNAVVAFGKSPMGQTIAKKLKG